MLDFDYSTKESREALIPELFARAKSAREPFDLLWKTYDNYYDGIHKIISLISDRLTEEEKEEAWAKAILTDPFIHVESQIDPTVPECQFIGRDRYTDYLKAKQRKYVVDYIMSINDMEGKNTDNERPLRKYGDSFMKVYFDASMMNSAGDPIGDIKIDILNIDDFFPDPTAVNLNDCEYIDYVYYLHKQKVKRIFGLDFKKAKINLDEIAPSISGITESVSRNEKGVDGDVEYQILEHWYRDKEGDIACSILIGETEIRHIQKYWQNTGVQNKLYPFVHFYRIRDERSFWNTSELKAMIPLVNAAERILNTALANMDLMSNDVWIQEEDALAENSEITNEPGSVIIVKPGKSSGVRRAGGIASLKEYLPDIEYLQGEMQRTVRNYDTNTGKETARVSTASGLAQIRADAMQQSGIKDNDRMQAFKRLFVLADWSGLEFYNDDRLIFIGVPENEVTGKLGDNIMENFDASKGSVFFTYNSDSIRRNKERIIGTSEEGQNLVKTDYYYPTVDCKVNASNSLNKSKVFTIQVLQALLDTPVTPENYKLAILLLEEFGIPHSQEIIDEWKKRFSTPSLNPQIEAILSRLPEEQQKVLRQNPQLIEAVVNNSTKPPIGGEDIAGSSVKTQFA